MVLEIIKERNNAINVVNIKRISEGETPIPECTWPGCNELRDGTPGMGMDTSCPYHRLLFDHWLYEISDEVARNVLREDRNKSIDEWAKELGKDECDKIVDEMSRVGINWMC